ncbi:S-layer homology domain-containing protein [Paenibacillus sp. LHD-117]|uniref:S-layer homology domain-containing protein n=1 Tax=Paenibacillus sp. LHD-117 TaxID=3071412 RepID=UPI0027DEC72B|nr:S-layer homology domain-containing protein [Paenibacillus sp. LHD-117]MDQ6421459.1 S-layer homology domain-containing protein [Paenibacillus sp. LHD-117]
MDGAFRETVDARHASRLTGQTVFSISGLLSSEAVKKSGGTMLVDGVTFSVQAETTPTPTPTFDSSTGSQPTPTPIVPTDQINEHEAYMEGYEDGNFKPDKNITRAEIATILSRVLTRDAVAENKNYGDVNEAGWAKDAISAMTRMGLMEGYPNGGFGPNKSITRAEMSKLVSLLIDETTETGAGFADVAGGWARDAILAVQGAGLMKGYEDGTFRPNNALT